ncbi:DSF synthase [Gelidibacter algens]|uniref:DSF synthase n=1 Tax=Gelidibacter algens TaxID=49280 RepID=A0A1A7QZZ3_9FLAO|nr:enoyl-CoA hydratase-related protein [Gelidibacter algens]OBX25131.1 hypothetical protein A9996_11540 [Gelidibacter algens]RAJ20019.1 DSF synthase [Gelidibacter algens]
MSLCKKKRVSRKIGTEIKIHIDEKQHLLYLRIGSNQNSCYSYETVCEFYNSLQLLQEWIQEEKIRYIILKSRYKLNNDAGSDVKFLLKCINDNDKMLLMDYAYKCAKIAYHLSISFNTNAIVISVLNGNAFGGTFEYALATQYVIAEEHIKFGFPESDIGIVPVLGAYNFLTPKVGFAKAKEIINSNKKWNASQMMDLNIITHVSKKGKGMETTLELIKEGEITAKDCLQKAFCNPSSEDLLKSIDLWMNDLLTTNPTRFESRDTMLENEVTV